MKSAFIPFLVGLLGCGDHDRHGPLQLAEGYRPSFPALSNATWPVTLASGTPLRLSRAADGRGIWIAGELQRSAWKRPASQRPKLWMAKRLFHGTGRPADGSSGLKLEADGKAYRFVALQGAVPDREVEVDLFGTAGGNLLLTVAEGAEPPERVVISEYIDLGHLEMGAWKVALDRYEATGFLLLPGFDVQLSRRIQARQQLLFACVVRSRAARTKGTLSLRVQCNESEVYRRSLDAESEPCATLHTVPLPEGTDGKVSLSFAIDGEAAVAAILNPRLIPVDTPAREDRPRGRPDIVLFMADTLRADILAAYGGDPILTPHLNEFAASGLVFETAWATSSWTLPSHATLFSGLFPHQSGVTSHGNALGTEAVTLAETLQAAGYRTGAVTDDAYVSPEFGLAQGFEWFDSKRRFEPKLRDFQQSLESIRTFLDMDDGRPVFLFVHTYRAHLPYLVSLASRARVGPSIGLRDDLNLDDYAQVPESIPNWTEAYEPKADLLRRMDNYRAVYRGGTADLDLAFGSFLELLRDYGMRSQAYMLFTSDHGEAFWEHGIAEHGNGVWNEHLDIPLLLVGPDVRAGRQSAPASLIDVPRTIAGLANVQAPASWGGCDLRLTADPAPLLAFECNRYGDPSEAALLDGGRKIILEVDLEARTWEPLAAFDLRTDPDERQNLASAPWVAELLAKHDRRIVQSLEERVVVHSALSHPESARALRELGYAGPADDGQ